MSPLDEYRRKRDFSKTPEPPGQGLRPSFGSFVVHRHEARRLHYDLRLEIGGVLKSWAIPKGFSYVTEDKRLAVRTEDHPLEYLEFHGVIPKGEYGAGTMTIWDRGEFALTGDASSSDPTESGKVEIILRGTRLRGEWHLVQTKSGGNEWLIFKSSDLYARARDELNTPYDFSAAKPAGFPRQRKFMVACETQKAFSDPQWSYELCFAGHRLLGVKNKRVVKLIDDQGVDWSLRCPAVGRAIGQVRAEAFLLDGVLVALDENERPSKEALAQVLEGHRVQSLAYYAFDLLYCEEFDLRQLPFVERKRALRWIMPKASQVMFVDHVAQEGEKLFEVARRGGLPGIVAKRNQSVYQTGPSEHWREIAVTADGEVGGKPLQQALLSSRSKTRRARTPLRNLQKVFWPAEGYTKGDLLSYYESVAEILLPYLRDRPLHLNRFPNGIEGKSFYQKSIPDLPDWIETKAVTSERKGETTHYVVCNDRDTLLYLVNLASIDLHPWLSRRDSMESPDWAVLDLDPKKAPFSAVVRIAKFIGKTLRGIGLRPLLKTSGASGLHIFIPLDPGYSYDHSRMFCEAIARAVVREMPEIATVDRVIESRDRKVYVDFLQNRRGQTIVPPYCVRPVPGATVSTPLDWDELDGELSPQMFNIKSMPERLARVGDLFQPALSDPQDLLPAIEAMQNQLRTQQ